MSTKSTQPTSPINQRVRECGVEVAAINMKLLEQFRSFHASFFRCGVGTTQESHHYAGALA